MHKRHEVRPEVVWIQPMTKGVKLDPKVAAELKALRKLRKEHEQLKMEHDLPKIGRLMCRNISFLLPEGGNNLLKHHN